MNFFDRQNLPLTAAERRDASLNAARVTRDLSFLRTSYGGVRLGCRQAMRQHALQWRQPLGKAVSSE